uniref:Peptidase metallopeptidase domain-containing protein n=1 Tax=Parascaris univalens TaxID=6257 RepID=A0A915C917_PARUN
MLAGLLVTSFVSLVAIGTAAPWIISGAESELDDVNDDRHPIILAERKWPYTLITWKLLKDHLSIGDRYVVRNTLHRAFYLWQSVSSIRFYELPEESRRIADINVIFAKGAHGDKLPFDGKDGIVAHAFYPTEGKLHFDADERWTLNRKDGVNLYQTAVHEIGHIIGLEHSTDERAVMFPSYRPYDPDYTLADDDVRGVRRLYPLLRLLMAVEPAALVLFKGENRDQGKRSPSKTLGAVITEAGEKSF